ncbi:cyclophilin-like fold protein [Corynebacterium crudilactis]|uniref:cyclophilin-like fold protein n=1 Tax=Corynebacterium crudilactis TaxID=1652495 RepID=UPI0012FE6356|nr:cyclophilin-like fold protein [Corynebacterium crudilactis]
MSTAASRVLATIPLTLLCVGLTACGEAINTSEIPPLSTIERPSTQTPVPEPTREPLGETVEETLIQIRVDNQILHATLRNNPAANALLAQLPLTLEFADYGGQEVTAVLPHPIRMDGMPAADTARTGDLTYYAPDGVIVMNYTNVGRWNGIAQLGRIEGDLSTINSRSEPFTVTIERVG